ncbi:MAG: hypothetical protein AAGI34_15230 [Pseudomonadota bacterium]
MRELLKRLRERAEKICATLFCHRMLHGGLSLCHGAGCWVTDKPELYGPMAVLYAILTVRG